MLLRKFVAQSISSSIYVSFGKDKGSDVVDFGEEYFRCLWLNLYQKNIEKS